MYLPVGDTTWLSTSVGYSAGLLNEMNSKLNNNWANILHFILFAQ